MNRPITKEQIYGNYEDYFKEDGQLLCQIKCGKGWLKIIDELCENLERIEAEEDSRNKIKIILVASRFGILKIKFRETKDDVLDLKLAYISQSCEVKSGIVCEECGKPARTAYSSTGAMKTLCDGCCSELGFTRDKT